MGLLNTGLAELANLAGNVSSPTGFTYMAVGTDNTAFDATHTALQAEITDSGFERAVATRTRVTTSVSSDTTQWLKEWTATAAKTIQEIGVLNAAAAGTLLIRQVVDPAASVAIAGTYSAIIRLSFASA